MAGIHDILAAALARTAFAVAADDSAGLGESVTHTDADGTATATGGCWINGPTLDKDADGNAEHQAARGEFCLRVQAPDGTVIDPALADKLLIGTDTYAIYDILEHNAAYATCRLLGDKARTRLAGPQSRLGGRG